MTPGTRRYSLALTVLALAWVVVPASGATSATTPTPCTSAQLAVTGVAAEGAAVSAGEIVRYRNVSDAACTLHGYPIVVMLGDSAHRALLARDERDGYLGGWGGYSSTSGPTPLPVVELRARGGVASSLIQWVGCSTGQQPGCVLYHRWWVEPPGGTRPVELRGDGLLLRYPSANPVVPGARGTAS